MTKKIGVILLILIVIVCAKVAYTKSKAIKLIDLSERASWLKTNQQVDETAKEAVERLIQNAEGNGMCLVVSSGYRSVEEQAVVKQKYGDLAEEPGKSEHHTGLAVDLVGCPMTNYKRDDTAERLELQKPFEELPEYAWLKQHAIEFGFKQTYSNEPWHWKLVTRKEFYDLYNPLIEDNFFTRPTPTPTKHISNPYHGKASYYTNDYCVQYNPTCETTNGEIFDDTKYTIACRKEIKLGSNVKITYKGKSVVARCNDRGSFSEKYGRVADLSKATFEALAPLSKGVLLVDLEVLK